MGLLDGLGVGELTGLRDGLEVLLMPPWGSGSSGVRSRGEASFGGSISSSSKYFLGAESQFATGSKLPVVMASTTAAENKNTEGRALAGCAVMQVGVQSDE